MTETVLKHSDFSEILKANGCIPIIGSLGMWKHTSRPILFNLCVDDFGVKYFRTEDVHHLIQTVEKRYKTTTDWKGENFLGFTLHWNYNRGYVDHSMLLLYLPSSYESLLYLD